MKLRRGLNVAIKQSFGGLKYKNMLSDRNQRGNSGPLQTFVVGKNDTRKVLRLNLLQNCLFATKSGYFYAV